MIGDGVNDVIALKEAKVGIAMQNGSQAARGVADLILLNDSFAALPYAFREGQRIINGMHDILRVFMVRILSKAFIIAIIGSLGGFPFAPRQASYLSFVGAGLPAAFLAAWAIPGPVPKVRLYRLLARFVLPGHDAPRARRRGDLLHLRDPGREQLPRRAPRRRRGRAARVRARPGRRPRPRSSPPSAPSCCSRSPCRPADWWAGGARVRGDRRILVLTGGILALHIGVLATSFGRTMFEITPLPVWQYVLLGACAVGWSLGCRLVWRSGILDGWLGTVDDPGNEAARKAREKDAAPTDEGPVEGEQTGRRAEARERALPARRAPRVTDAAPVPHQVDVRGVHVLRLRTGERGQLGVRLLGRRLRGDQPEPPRHPMHVRVDRHDRPLEGEEQHAGRGLGPDPRQPRQVRLRLGVGHVVELRQVGLARALAHRREDRLDARRLGVREPAERDRLLDRRDRRVAHLGPAREARLERREGAVGVHVGGVLREDRVDELVDRRVARREDRPSVGVVEDAHDAAQEAARALGRGGTASSDAARKRR